MEAEGFELGDGAEVGVHIHVGGGEGGSAIVVEVGGVVDGIADDGGVLVGEVDAEVAEGVAGEVEDVELCIAKGKGFVAVEGAGDRYAVACPPPSAGLLEEGGALVGGESQTVVVVVGGGAEVGEAFGGFDLFLIEGAAEELGVGGELAHGVDAAGVIDIGVGDEDVGEVLGVEVEVFEEGEDLGGGGGGVAGVDEEALVAGAEEVEVQGAGFVGEGELGELHERPRGDKDED